MKNMKIQNLKPSITKHRTFHYTNRRVINLKNIKSPSAHQAPSPKNKDPPIIPSLKVSHNDFGSNTNLLAETYQAPSNSIPEVVNSPKIDPSSKKINQVNPPSSPLAITASSDIKNYITTHLSMPSLFKEQLIKSNNYFKYKDNCRKFSKKDIVCKNTNNKSMVNYKKEIAYDEGKVMNTISNVTSRSRLSKPLSSKIANNSFLFKNDFIRKYYYKRKAETHNNQMNVPFSNTNISFYKRKYDYAIVNNKNQLKYMIETQTISNFNNKYKIKCIANSEDKKIQMIEYFNQIKKSKNCGKKFNFRSSTNSPNKILAMSDCYCKTEKNDGVLFNRNNKMYNTLENNKFYLYKTNKNFYMKTSLK